MMLQDIAPNVYRNEFSKQAPKPADFVLWYENRTVLAREENGSIVLPKISDLPSPYPRLQYAFSLDNTAYFLVLDAKMQPLSGFSPLPCSRLRELLPSPPMFAAAVGESLARWYGNQRFCGRCGKPMQPGETERSMVCPACGNTVYPKICPAVIVAVRDGERLLLTRYAGRAFKRYALIAGFNEIGESIEDTVHREVLEEVGLRVKNLRFYKSQPWVFTDTLLMGFACDLDGSDRITLQEDELAEGEWFSRENLPDDYSPISLTGEMIEQFRIGAL